jgi:hypothetical protein
VPLFDSHLITKKVRSVFQLLKLNFKWSDSSSSTATSIYNKTPSISFQKFQPRITKKSQPSTSHLHTEKLSSKLLNGLEVRIDHVRWIIDSCKCKTAICRFSSLKDGETHSKAIRTLQNVQFNATLSHLKAGSDKEKVVKCTRKWIWMTVINKR